jgi:DNA-binding MarR family transcriptional regulator
LPETGVAAETPWYEVVSIPALLRHARYTYGTAMREALEAAGHGDIPKNGLYVIGGLALGAGDAPLSVLIRDLRISKQAAGQLVDALVERGYLERTQDPDDRRRQVVALTARGRAAAEAQCAAAQRIDAQLAERVGATAPGKLRKLLAVLVGIGREGEQGTAP